MPDSRAGNSEQGPQVSLIRQRERDPASLAAFLNQNPNPILECDAAGQITYANPAAQRLLDSLPASRLLPPNFSQLVERCLREKASIIGQESQAGGRTLLWSLHPGSDGDRMHLFAADVTDRKQAEEALQQSEEKYRNILQSIEDGYYEVDLAGNFTYFNDSLCRTLGYPPDELMGMNNQKYTDRQTAKKVYEAFDSVYRTGEPTKEFDWEVIRKDSTKICVGTSIHLVRDLAGAPVGFRGILRDITERKRTEEALRLTQFSINHAADATFWFGPDARFFYVNDAACLSLGYSREELLSMSVHDIDPNISTEVWPDTWKSVKQARSRTFESRHQTSNGQGFPVEITANYLQFDGREYICAFARDITRRKQAEQKLEERRTYLNALIENTPLAIVVVDPEQRVQMCNPAFERIFLYRREEAVGNLLDELVALPEGESEAMQLSQRVRAGESVHAATRRRRKDGSRVDVEMYTLPLIVNGEHIGSYALYQDITERCVLEDQLRQAQKMEAVGRLAGGVAHDFNNMLMVIGGYCELLLSKVREDDPQFANAQEIKRAADRASSLTQQLLAFSRKQMLQPRVINLNVLVGEMDKMLRRLIGEDIELVTLLGSKLRAVKADPGQLEQVILNLAVNARDAMPQGGKLTIETHNVELDMAYASQHTSVRPGAYILLGVSDTGCGMDAETRSRLFEPFFTTKDKDKGTGLGLATLYGIVKQSGGHIWVYSEPGRGSTFKVYLPRVEERSEETGAGPESSQYTAALGTVLVVEDEEGVRKLACEFLRSAGYAVLEACNGPEAIHAAEQHRGPIHVMVTDVVMPGMSGRALAGALEPLRPDMRVLYVSGYTENAIVHHGVIDRGTAFLQKPVSLAVLAKTVGEMIETGGHELPRAASESPDAT